jgi:Ca2+-binding RTX toxin-like protein
MWDRPIILPHTKFLEKGSEMLRALLNRWRPNRQLRIPMRRGRTYLQIHRLEDRATPAVTASFASGNLTVTGDNLDNNIVISRDTAGKILINNGVIRINGAIPTVANTRQIQLFGLAGHDTLALDESQGSLPRANIFGGAGNDLLIGGAGSDLLFGQGGDDTLFGMGGPDMLFGGTENDTLIGGAGDDQVFGESGHDRFVWNPGDGADLNEGGAGSDTIEVNGGVGSETFTVTANGTRVRLDRLNPAPFTIDIGTSENLVLNANGGDDFFSATGNLAALIQLTVDGGAGNDTILGSNGPDLLLGGDGNDFIDGQQGNDLIFLGAGNDVFQWDPGDGSDVVDGQDGQDTMLFNGSAAAEIFEVSANGSRARFTRNVGNIVMDLDGIERLDLNALGGVDTVIANDVVGTALKIINVSLTVNGTGDNAADTIIVNGTNNADIIDVFGSGTSFTVVGLAAQINAVGSEGANDVLVINALGGNDGVTATTVPAGIVKMTIDGGAGDDVLLGSQGADVLLGGDGNDFIFGDGGDDLALLGAGNDVFQWEPGDGSDTIEGQDGVDRLVFFGSNANETVNIVANGGRVLFLRDVANVVMDVNRVESIDFRALGGADNIFVGDLTGTDVTTIGLDLHGPNGGGDEQPDTITVNGTQGADVFGAVGDAGGVTVFGLAAKVNIFHQEQANDRLILNGLGGNDVIDATSLEADGIQLTLNGGLGNDVLIGSEGNDLIIGGGGDDLALMGAGDDTFTWNPGDDNDTIEGQDGYDVLVFNGANAAENIDISANEGRMRFFRNVANVVMDANDLERVDFNALGGADVIVVNDLTGTDVVEVNINLASSAGTGDAQPDTIVLMGTADDDAILVFGDAAGATVMGLAAQVNIFGHEAANDRLVINALAGDDVVDASGLAACILLTIDGGDGDDVLIGSDGNDVILGGPGDDILIGGPGLDILDGGPGNNIVIQ